MPRLGSQKVKTGCKTCKIRKVKCDETWPQCLRCQKTGRTCDGYQAPPTGSFSWDVLLRRQPSVSPVSDHDELRSLAFFHHVVAPVLSGPFDPSFWTHVVAQVTHHEPAARHAVLAISSFFEGFSVTTLRTKDNPFAICHYNRAIKRLLTEPSHDIDTVLTVCVLFICIEFLRGDEKAAINHTRHGLRLLGTRGGSSQLTAVFCQVGIIPLFFGPKGPKITDAPPLITDSPDPDGTFQSILEAKHCLDVIMARTVWLVRRTEYWQVGADPDFDVTPAMRDEQRDIAAAYEHWGASFARLQASRGMETSRDAGSLALRIRSQTGRIWIQNCLTRGELRYDRYKKDAESIIEMAQCALSLEAAQAGGRPKKFMFDMGFSPLLHFFTLKCRYLHLRIRALALLKGLACARETLWDAMAMQAIGRRVIEVEHGIELDPEDLEGQARGFEDAELPPERDRVRGYCQEDLETFQPQEGVRVYQRPVRLLMFGPDGGMEYRSDWITIYA